MTFHKRRGKQTKGHRPDGDRWSRTSPRITVSFDPLVLKAIVFLSEKWDVPASEVVRRGMLGYTTPLLYDLAVGREPNFKAAVK